MKARVLETFRDKHDMKKVYKKGAIITVSKERFEEILQTGKFVEPVEEKKPAKKKAE